ncbi:unnamed protein product, partial [Ectocarpus fasciculatus]
RRDDRDHGDRHRLLQFLHHLRGYHAARVGRACGRDGGAGDVLLRRRPHLSRGGALDAHLLVHGHVRCQHGHLFRQWSHHRRP